MADHSLNSGPDNHGPTTSSLSLSQEQLRRMNKVVLFGQLATGMVHDFNHVLNVIRGYSELLLGEPMESNAAREKLLQIRKAVDRGESLARQLLTFSRKESRTPVSLDVNRLLEDLKESFVPGLAGRIEMRIHLDANVGTAKFDPVHLQQIVMNLVVNARDAMPNGGRLTIKTARVVLDEGQDSESSHNSQRDFVLVEVTDTGCGMEPATRSRIFEPFFTTKETAGGTGLGLANVRELLTRNGGHVRVESTPGRGSTFQVFVPCLESGQVDLAAEAF